MATHSLSDGQLGHSNAGNQSEATRNMFLAKRFFWQAPDDDGHCRVLRLHRSVSEETLIMGEAGPAVQKLSPPVNCQDVGDLGGNGTTEALEFLQGATCFAGFAAVPC